MAISAVPNTAPCAPSDSTVARSAPSTSPPAARTGSSVSATISGIRSYSGRSPRTWPPASTPWAISDLRAGMLDGLRLGRANRPGRPRGSRRRASARTSFSATSQKRPTTGTPRSIQVETCASSRAASVAAGIRLTPNRSIPRARSAATSAADQIHRLAHHAEKAEPAALASRRRPAPTARPRPCRRARSDRRSRGDRRPAYAACQSWPSFRWSRR